MVITSRHNEKIQALLRLKDAAGRRESGLHCIEGDKLVRDAAKSGASLACVYLEEGCEQLAPAGVPVQLVSRSVLEAVSTVKTPQHLIATVVTPKLTLPASFPTGLIVALDRLQDAGNVGTIIRTADALGAAAVLLSPDCADPFSPRTLRAAMGSQYHLPLYEAPLTEALPMLSAQGFLCLCGHLRGEETLPEKRDRMVLVVGNEGAGVSDETAALCTLYRLPMRGKAESLNAAVFAALLMQRLLS